MFDTVLYHGLKFDLRYVVTELAENQDVSLLICKNNGACHSYIKFKSINMIKRHTKPTKENKGGIISKESFIHLSNVKNIDLKKEVKKGVSKK